MGILRIKKVDENIQKILSKIINEIVSEDIAFVSVNFVHTTKDLKESKIFIGMPQQNKKNWKLFSKYIPIIKKEFSKKIKLKFTPTLTFVSDEKQKEINNVEMILNQLNKK